VSVSRQIYTPEIVAGLKVAATIGHNNPPEPTPFEQSRDEIDGLYMEAANWIDGAAIETQGQADIVGKLINELRAAEKRAEANRKAEAKPFDDGKAEVQARYKPLSDKATRAINASKRAVGVFLEAEDRKKREEAELARLEAEHARKAAEELARKARENDSLAAIEAREIAIQNAKEADAYAAKAEKDKAAAKGGGRAITLRTVKRANIVNMTEFAKYVWTDHRADIDEWMQGFAQQLVRAGKLSLPGVEIVEERVAQ
jgi:hypothetical protein